MSLSTALKLAAAPAALVLAGCVTNPLVQNGSGQTPVEGNPHAFEVVNPAGPASLQAATLTLGVKDCNKNMTTGTVAAAATGANGACIGVIIAGEPEKKAGAGVTKASTERKSRRVDQPTAPAAQVAGATKTLLYPMQITASECGAIATSFVTTITNIGKGAVDIFGQALGNRAGQVGGQVGGTLGARGARDAAGAVTQSGKGQATAAAAPLTEAEARCNTTLSDLAKGDFNTQVTKILKDWKAANTGFVPVVTFSSELSAAQEASFRASLATATAAVGGRTIAPR